MALSVGQISIHQPVCTTALMTLAPQPGWGKPVFSHCQWRPSRNTAITCCCSREMIELQGLYHMLSAREFKVHFLVVTISLPTDWLCWRSHGSSPELHVYPCSFCRVLACQGQLCHLIEYSLDVEWKLYSRQTSKLTHFKVSFLDYYCYCPHGKVCLKTQSKTFHDSNIYK